MNITKAKYAKDPDGNNSCVLVTIDDTPMAVPLDPNNRHYAEIMKQVAEGTLTIEDAD